METKYTQIRPEDVFTVTVERTVKHDTREKMHYEYAFTVKVCKTQNDFINLFAELLVRHGRHPASFYAELMSVNERGLMTTLQTLTGVGIREWVDAFAAKVSETLLSETTLSIGEIAIAAGWSSQVNGLSCFSRWFEKCYNCSPFKWRQENR